MDKKKITIAIDAMGGENSQNKVINGSEIFLKSNVDAELIMFGNEDLIDKKFLDKYSKNVTFIHCTEVILDNDKPSSILRSKKDSSMRKL